jgi:phosphoribosylanthranilate isomerase
MRTKVCGLTQLHQLEELNDMGVEFGGFIFYAKSPRYVLNSMQTKQIKGFKGNLNKVGVFVNASEQEILDRVDDCGLYLVQLHGNETPKFCEKISNYITTIKAFRVDDNFPLAWQMKEYEEVVDMYLFDTAASGFGGTGLQFNWNILTQSPITKPFFLSGGIGANNIDEIKQFASLEVGKNLFCIDINSKFEQMPGIKDLDLVKNFVSQLKNV